MHKPGHMVLKGVNWVHNDKISFLKGVNWVHMQKLGQWS